LSQQDDINPVLRYFYEAAVSYSKLEKLHSVLGHFEVQLRPLSHKCHVTQVINLRIQKQGHKHRSTTSEFLLAASCMEMEMRNRHKILVGGIFKR